MPRESRDAADKKARVDLSDISACETDLAA